MGTQIVLLKIFNASFNIWNKNNNSKQPRISYPWEEEMLKTLFTPGINICFWQPDHKWAALNAAFFPCDLVQS